MTVSEWDHRELCPDGACVGVIGPEGTCRVCGRAAPNWGDERTRGLVDSDDAEDPDDDVPAIATAATERRLCPDGACVGLIGPDGRCKVCGTPASDAAAAGHAAPSPDDADDADGADDDAEDAAPAPRTVRAEVAATPARTPASAAPDDTDPEADDADDDEDDDAADVDAAADDDDRRLCPDGACIGVLGADGRCKVCGKAAE